MDVLNTLKKRMGEKYLIQTFSFLSGIIYLKKMLELSSEARKIIGEGRQKAIGLHAIGISSLRLIYFYIHSSVFCAYLLRRKIEVGINIKNYGFQPHSPSSCGFKAQLKYLFKNT
ncbi:MAG: hypothetical protein ACFB2X_25820 [Rivularia sp. (in: cyanobacteria)]